MGSFIDIAQHLNYPVVEKPAAANERAYGAGCFTPVTPIFGSNFKPSITIYDAAVSNADMAKSALAVLDMLPDDYSPSPEMNGRTETEVFESMVKTWLNSFDTGVVGYNLSLVFSEPNLPMHNDMGDGDEDENGVLQEHASAACWLLGYLDGFREKVTLIGSKMERIFAVSPLMAISLLRWMAYAGMQTTVPMLPEVQFTVVANGEDIPEEDEDGYSMQLFRKHYPDWAFDNTVRAGILNQQYQKEESECYYPAWELFDSVELYLEDVAALDFDLSSPDGLLCQEVREVYLSLAGKVYYQLSDWSQDWYHLYEPSCVVGWKDADLAIRAADDFHGCYDSTTDIIFSQPIQDFGDFADALESLKPGLEFLSGYRSLLQLLEGD